MTNMTARQDNNDQQNYLKIHFVTSRLIHGNYFTKRSIIKWCKKYSTSPVNAINFDVRFSFR